MSEPAKRRIGELANERLNEPTGQSQSAHGVSSSGPSPFTLASSRPRLLASSGVGLTVVAVIYLALAIAFSQVMHFSRALDEGYHLEYITFIKQNGRLPMTYEERSQITRADFPPLYHLLVALLSARISVDGPPSFKLFWDSFRYRAMDHQTDGVWTIATEDYQRPYLGRFLVWQIGRWFSIVLSLVTVIVVFVTLQETPLGRSPMLPLAGAALLAFIPRYMMLSSALNDDTLLGLLAALYFWALVKALKRPQRWWPFVILGILLGLSMTVKYTLVLLPLEIVIMCGLLAQKSGLGWSWAWRRLSVTGLLALLCSSWWFGWNIWFLNTVKTQGWFIGLLNPLLAGGNDTTMNRLSGLFSGGQIGLANLPEDTIVGTFPQWAQSTFLSFWGASPSFSYAYLAIGLMLAISAFGLWRLWQIDSTSRKWLALLIFHAGIFFVLPLIRFGLTRRLSVAGQGRHILVPAAAAIVGLLVWGVATAIPSRWQRWIFLLITAGFIGWTIAHLYQLDMFNPPPLSLRALPQAAEWLPHPTYTQFSDPFGGKVELVSYEIDPQPEGGLLNLNLAWRSVAYANQSYLLEVTLLNIHGQVVSHWTGYNGQGRLPTLAWDPGDSVFDRLVLPLPNLPAGDYTVQVQLRGSTGPLAVSQRGDEEARGRGGEEANKDDSAQENILSLTSVSLSEPSTLALPQRLSITTPTGPVEVAFALWQTNGPIPDLPIDNSQLILPHFRYPATISIIVSPLILEETTLQVELVDANGQAWPATRSEANIYTFVVGPRWQSGDYYLRMTWPGGGETTSEPILTVENWWPRHFEAPEIAVPQAANFANQLRFLGHKLPRNRVKAGEAFPLTLYWQAPPTLSPQADFIQFNHLLDSRGALQGGYDRRPLEYYSTLLWAPGEVVIDGYAVPVATDAPPGEYYLSVGYYLTVGESAVNLPLVMDGHMTEVSSITIGPIEVVAP